MIDLALFKGPNGELVSAPLIFTVGTPLNSCEASDGGSGKICYLTYSQVTTIASVSIPEERVDYNFGNYIYLNEVEYGPNQNDTYYSKFVVDRVGTSFKDNSESEYHFQLLSGESLDFIGGPAEFFPCYKTVTPGHRWVSSMSWRVRTQGGCGCGEYLEKHNGKWIVGNVVC